MSVSGWPAGNGRADGEDSRAFSYALAGAFVLEVALVAIVAFWPHSRPRVVRPSSIAVQMVSLPTPVPPQPRLRPVTPPPVVHKIPPKPMVTKTRVHEVVPRPVKPKVLPKPVPVVPPHRPAPVVRPHKIVSVKPQKPAPAAHPSPQRLASLMSRYVGLVRPMIQGHLHVPAMLKVMGLSGHSTIEFRLSPRGRLLWAKVLVPSRIRAVNGAALDAVEYNHYPPFLKHMPKRDTTFEIVVHISGDGS